MSTEHTPGPWTLDTCWNGWTLMANGRNVIAEPFDCEHADARLIAAAPDLLAALRAVAAFVADEVENREAAGSVMSDYQNEARDALDRIEAAIAKAT